MQVKHCTARTDYAEAANHSLSSRLLSPVSEPDSQILEVITLGFHTLPPFLEAIVQTDFSNLHKNMLFECCPT